MEHSPKPETTPALLRVSAVALRLGISRTLVYGLVEKGRLKCYRIGLGRGGLRFSEEDLIGAVVVDAVTPHGKNFPRSRFVFESVAANDRVVTHRAIRQRFRQFCQLR